MSIEAMIMILMIILGVISAMCIWFLKEIAQSLKKLRRICVELINRNESMFTISFIFVFLIEEVMLILILAYFFDLPKWVSVIVGIFALFVVTTATFQKFIWEYKFKWSEEARKEAKNTGEIMDEQEHAIRQSMRIQEKQEQLIIILQDKLEKEHRKSKKK